ncbi:MAG: MFS transporter [Actinomycetota bacterium]|nr:MFS transporter [Actinomycetota bacterium]
MPRRAPIRIAAPEADVRAAALAHLDAQPREDGTLFVTGETTPDPSVGVLLTLVGDGTGTLVHARRAGRFRIPFFSWFFRPLIAAAGNRYRDYAVTTLRHECEGGPEPTPPTPVFGLPTVPFTTEQATLLAVAAASVAIVGFGSSLFGQFADPIADSFGASDSRLSFALGFTRVGAVIAVFATALADRHGRRRAILFGIGGCAVAAALSAVAPTFEMFTLAQVLQRACLFITGIVAGIATIEEAPEGARAYAASMLALAGGLGFSFTVVLLPLADFGDEAWRIPYGIAALSILLLPRVSRRLTETSRYLAVSSRAEIARGRVRELFDARYGRRFVLLAAIGFLTNIFNAPSSQLMNKYLRDERDFSNTGIAVFRTITTALPGLIGLVVGGQLAERYGRKPVAIWALIVATVTQMVFFVYGGPVIWVMSGVSVLTSAAAGVALGTLDAELFPTELRGTSNGLLTMVNVTGSFAGLMLAAELPFAGVGPAIALLGVTSLCAAIFLVPRLPETSAQLLDDVSPSEPIEDNGPGP